MPLPVTPQSQQGRESYATTDEAPGSRRPSSNTYVRSSTLDVTSVAYRDRMNDRMKKRIRSVEESLHFSKNPGKALEAQTATPARLDYYFRGALGVNEAKMEIAAHINPRYRTNSNSRRPSKEGSMLTVISSKESLSDLNPLILEDPVKTLANRRRSLSDGASTLTAACVFTIGATDADISPEPPSRRMTHYRTALPPHPEESFSRASSDTRVQSVHGSTAEFNETQQFLKRHLSRELLVLDHTDDIMPDIEK